MGFCWGCNVFWAISTISTVGFMSSNGMRISHTRDAYAAKRKVRLEWSLDQPGRDINIVIIIISYYTDKNGMTFINGKKITWTPLPQIMPGLILQVSSL